MSQLLEEEEEEECLVLKVNCSNHVLILKTYVIFEQFLI